MNQSFRVVNIESSEEKEAPWFVLNEVSEIFRSRNRQILCAQIFSSEIFLSYSLDMFNLCFMIYYCRVTINNLSSSNTSISLRHMLNNLLDLFNNSFVSFVRATSNKSFHKAFIREHIRSSATIYSANCEYVLIQVHI